MRIHGRTLRASNLAERRLLKALGVDALRVPRRLNPFAVARQLRKLARGGEFPTLRALLAPMGVTTAGPAPIAVQRNAEHTE